MFFEILENLKKEKNINTDSDLLEEIGLGRNTMTIWKQDFKKDGKLPEKKYLYMLAGFFNVTTDYLINGSKATETISKTEREKRIISKYRNNPKIKKIIDTILELEEDSTDDSDLKSALESPIVLEKVQN